MYYYEGMPTEEPKVPAIEKVSITTKSHPRVVESHSDTELHTIVEHQTDNVELQNREAHSDIEVE